MAAKIRKTFFNSFFLLSVSLSLSFFLPLSVSLYLLLFHSVFFLLSVSLLFFSLSLFVSLSTCISFFAQRENLFAAKIKAAKASLNLGDDFSRNTATLSFIPRLKKL